MSSDWRTPSYRLSYVVELQASEDQIPEAWGVEHDVPIRTVAHDYNWLRARKLKTKIEMTVADTWLYAIFVAYKMHSPVA
jgi:hypothetical protein